MGSEILKYLLVFIFLPSECSVIQFFQQLDRLVCFKVIIKNLSQKTTLVYRLLTVFLSIVPIIFKICHFLYESVANTCGGR